MHLTTWIPLLFVPPAVAAIILLVRRKDWFAARRRRAMVAGGLAAALLLLALCGPLLNIPSGEAPTVIFLGDASPSMRFGQPWTEAAEWVRRALPADNRFGIVAFSGTSQTAVAPSQATPSAVELRQAGATAGPETNIAQAIRSGLALAESPRRTALLLYSDGHQTAGDALAAATEAREKGFRLFCLPPAKPPAPPNAAIVDLQAPEQLAPGQQATVRVAVLANRGGTVRVTLVDQSESSATLLGQASVGLDAGVLHWVEFPVIFAAPGRHRLEAQLADFKGDAVPEDDRWAFGVQVGDTRPLLVVYYESESPTASLPLSLEGEGGPSGPGEGVAPSPGNPAAARLVERVEASRMPTDAAALGHYAAVVLQDVPAWALSSQSLAALTEYVRDMGGGLVAVAGENSFGLGGYSSSVLDDLLPVKSDPEDRPPVRVAIVLDHSASMAGAADGQEKLALAKEAALQISTLLGAKDTVGLVVFNHEHETLAADVDTAHWERLRAAIGPLRATGGTRIGPALEAALGQLARTPDETADHKPVRRRIIAVSDGLVVGEDQQAPFDVAALAARARSLGVTISVVLTGESGSWAGLRKLATTSGGRFYDISSGLVSATGRNRLARIFLEDLDLPVLETKPHVVRIRDAAPVWPAPAAPPRLSEVGQFIVTEPKERAALNLETVPSAAKDAVARAANLADRKPRPILATWPYGLGRAVAWTAPWQAANAAFVADRRVREGFESAVRWAARGPMAAADYDVSVAAPGGRLAATVAQRRLSGGLARMPRMMLTLAGAAGGAGEKRLALDPTGPGTWTLARSIPAGAYAYALVAGEAPVEQLVRRGTLSTGPAEEFRHLDNNERFLGQLAELGGGRVLGAPAEAGQLAVAGERRVDLWPYLLALAALVGLYDALWALVGRGN